MFSFYIVFCIFVQRGLTNFCSCSCKRIFLKTILWKLSRQLNNLTFFTCKIKIWVVLQKFKNIQVITQMLIIHIFISLCVRWDIRRVQQKNARYWRIFKPFKQIFIIHLHPFHALQILHCSLIAWRLLYKLCFAKLSKPICRKE